MPAKQLEAPCWVPCATDRKPDPEGPHWPSAEKAAEHLDPGDQPTPFPFTCWTVTCDGPDCGEELENDEVGALHFETEAQAREYAPHEEWFVKDDVFLCPDCSTASARGTW